ncbi:MAG: hypothetical protein JXA09_10400 [Anaerolineae bacterium]|nr:hypothetical protein [Anaerolineae bacterium]
MSGGATTAAMVYRHQALNAIKACGTLVTVGPIEFMAIVGRTDNPFVIWSQGGWINKHFKYLTNYRGLAFYCKSPTPLEMPIEAEMVAANKITIPDL